MASQTGQHDHIDDQESIWQETPLLDELRATPGSFSFPQAVDIARRCLRSKGYVLSPESFRYTVNPSLAFPPGDIQELAITFDKRNEPRVSLMLNLMGLHGSASPLPSYFTDHVAQHVDEADALRDFFDIFNHRLVSLLHDTWIKYRYYAQYEARASDRLSSRFFSFIGAGHKEVRGVKELHWPKLMPYMGLIAFNSDAPGTLEEVLRHYFGWESISIIPCITRWVAVPKDQQSRLGESGCTLGEDFILGEEVPDQTGKFRVSITKLTWERFNSFLPLEKNFRDLQTLVRFVLKSRLEFDVELRLLPDEIRPWCLDDDNECRLGWSTWAGEGGDGAIILETDHQEM